MPFYRICPQCRAYLDFGERCDCQDKEKAAPDAANTQDGQKVECESTHLFHLHFTEKLGGLQV